MAGKEKGEMEVFGTYNTKRKGEAFYGLKSNRRSCTLCRHNCRIKACAIFHI